MRVKLSPRNEWLEVVQMTPNMTLALPTGYKKLVDLQKDKLSNHTFLTSPAASQTFILAATSLESSTVLSICYQLRRTS